MIMRSKQSGFTLVEIAIVLVIIGLLLGGVLKGQELINSAKVKNLANDFRNVSTFIYAYQDKYRALPGDDRAATAHLGAPAVCAVTPACPEPPGANVGNGRINGAWLGAAQTDESYMFWQHVRVANLASGSTTLGAADYLPRNADGGLMGVTGEPVLTVTVWAGNYFVCSAGIQGRFARQIDTMIDDGNTITGTVRVIGTTAENIAAPGGLATAATSGVNLTPAEDTNLYTVCMAF
jgi:prepilin-type N-terminal cleavage/methylation domain-containing protein